jgi:hypothetical protein
VEKRRKEVGAYMKLSKDEQRKFREARQGEPEPIVRLLWRQRESVRVRVRSCMRAGLTRAGAGPRVRAQYEEDPPWFGTSACGAVARTRAWRCAFILAQPSRLTHAPTAHHPPPAAVIIPQAPFGMPKFDNGERWDLKAKCAAASQPACTRALPNRAGRLTMRRPSCAVRR